MFKDYEIFGEEKFGLAGEYNTEFWLVGENNTEFWSKRFFRNYFSTQINVSPFATCFLLNVNKMLRWIIR